MKPTVGRIVHFHKNDDVFAAIVTRVFSDTCVNLTIFLDYGSIDSMTSVLEGTSSSQWSWPVLS